MKTEHWVEWLAPGAFFPEESNEKLETTDITKLKIPKDVYAFHFYDIETRKAMDEDGKSFETTKQTNKSCRYIIGTVYTIEQLEKMNKATIPEGSKSRGEYGILISNIGQYDTKSAVKTHMGNWNPLLDDDVVIDPKTVMWTDPVIYKNYKGEDE